jgi:hypothetical protein
VLKPDLPNDKIAANNTFIIIPYFTTPSLTR